MSAVRTTQVVYTAHLLYPDVEHVFDVPRGKGATVTARKTGPGGAWSSTLRVMRRIGGADGIVSDFSTPKTLTSAAPSATISETEMVGCDAVVVAHSSTPDAAGTYVRIAITIDEDRTEIVLGSGQTSLAPAPEGT